MAGVSKIGTFAGTQTYMASAGVPGALLPAVIALEALGGIALILAIARASLRLRWRSSP